MRLRLFTTNACNLRCSYCVMAHDVPRAGTLETMRNACRWAVQNYPDEAVYEIAFSGGGEPMLCFELISGLVERVQSEFLQTFKFFMITNGTLLDTRWAQFFRKHQGVFFPLLSLDGDAQTQNSQRDGSFASIDYAAWREFTHAVSLTVTPANVEKLKHNIEFLLDQGFYEISANLEHKDWDPESLFVYDQQLGEIVELALVRYAEGRGFIYTLFARNVLINGQVQSTYAFDNINLAVGQHGELLRCLAPLSMTSPIIEPQNILGTINSKLAPVYGCVPLKTTLGCTACEALNTCIRCSVLLHTAASENICAAVRIEHKHTEAFLKRIQNLKGATIYERN